MKGSTGEWYYGNSDGTAVLGWVRSGGEDYMGQVAVANVILNRLRSGKFGKTLSSVH